MGEVSRYHEIETALAYHGCLVTRMNAGRRGVRLAPAGWADFIGCSRDGRFLAVEVKQPGGKQFAVQLAFEYEVKRRKGAYVCITDASDLASALRNSGVV